MNKSPTDRPIILQNQAGVLQQILDYVQHGYDQYVSGILPLDKLEGFVRKMTLKYPIWHDKHARSRRKRAGLGNVVMILYQKDAEVYWWMLVQRGDCMDAMHERLVPTEQMVVFGCRLTQMTRKTQNKPARTWGMTHERYEYWRQTIIDAVRSREPYRMLGVLVELYKTPGFHGCRVQVGKLATLYRGEVKRASLTKIAPQPPTRLGYVRRLPLQCQSVRQVIRRQRHTARLSGTVHP